MHLGNTKVFKDNIVVAAPIANVAGLAAETTVMTLDGEMPVEHLNVGDRIIICDAGMSVLRDIKTHTVHVAPIKIKAGSLGHTRPQDDMLVGPDTLVHIATGAQRRCLAPMLPQ